MPLDTLINRQLRWYTCFQCNQWHIPAERLCQSWRFYASIQLKNNGDLKIPLYATDILNSLFVIVVKFTHTQVHVCQSW